MFTHISKTVMTLAMVSGSFSMATSVMAGDHGLAGRKHHCGGASGTSVSSPVKSTQQSAVVMKRVQKTPAYHVCRTELICGSRYTVFANFLEEKAGRVQVVVHGMTHACELIEWKNNSVTVTLPMLGLDGPKSAVFRIIRPDGRTAKRIPVVLISQPDFVLHEETVGQPAPADPGIQSPAFAPHGMGN